MRVGKHTWALKAHCPDCGQGSALVLVACPSCGHLALHCDEVMTPVFPDPRDLASQAIPSVLCPTCGKHAIEDFDKASREAIDRAGFASDELTSI